MFRRKHDDPEDPRNHKNPRDVPGYGKRISLTCLRCGRAGLYDVGAILISPAIRGANTNRPMSESISFTRYFRCRDCDAGGPWNIALDALGEITGRFARFALTGHHDGIYYGEPRTFDGKWVKYPTEAAVYIQSLIEKTPDSAELWLRLGNVYANGLRPDLAVDPLKRAIELAPRRIELRAELAECFDAMNRPRDARAQWVAALEAAADDDSDRETVRSTVDAALRALGKAGHQNEALAVLKRHCEANRASLTPEPNGSTTLVVKALDLAKDRDWEQFVSMFTGERIIPKRAERSEPRPALVVRHTKPLGGNAKCPCGSGRKQKKCCGAAAGSPKLAPKHAGAAGAR